MQLKHSQSQSPRSRDGICLAILVASFVISRLIYYNAGIRFDMTSLEWYWQYIDPHLLRTRLLESTYYLHSQPPLFNLFLGVVLKAFPGRELLAFALAYRALGMILGTSMFLLMRGLRVRVWISLPLAIAFVTSPTCIFFENWLLYAYPLATFICLAAVLLHMYLSTERLCYGALFFTALAVVVLTRSMFHLVWFLLFLCILLIHRRRNWKQVAIACLIPLLAVCFVYIKNLVLFDSFASSTWVGMSLGKMTTFKIPEEERRDLIGQGTISQLGLVRPFSQIDAYKEFIALPEKTGVPVLDQERKTGGHPELNTNFNNLVFVAISKQYLKDALEVLRLHPSRYGQMVMLSFGIYFFPANEYKFFEGNRNRIRSLDRFYNRFIYGQLLSHESHRWRSPVATRHDIGRLVPIGFFLAVGFIAFIITGWRHMKLESDPILRVTLLFVYLTVIYVTLVANLVEIGENNRFRFIVDPLILAGLGLCLNDIVTRLQTKASPTTPRSRRPQGDPE